MKKIIGLLLSLCLLFSVTGCKPNEEEQGKTLLPSVVGAPDYTEYENDRMEIGGWVIPVPTKENFLLAKEAGLSFFHNVNRDFSGQGVGDLDTTMKLLEEVGLQAYVQLQGSSYTEYEHGKFMRYKSFAGFNFYDEPSAGIFDFLRDEAAGFKKKFPEKKAFANLFPSYANSAQLGTDTFENYVKTYVNTVPCDILSFDYYPMKGNSASSQIDSGWLSALDIMANAAKDKKLEFWSFLQSMSYGSNMRAPKSKADISLQAYVNMCFGVKGLQYFCYMSPAIGPEFTAADVAMIDRNNNKTPIYDYVKQANEDILSFDHVFLRYDWENVMAVYGSEETKQNSAFKSLKHAMAESDYFTDAKATHDALIGQFADVEKGSKGFLIVNYSDPFYPKSTEVSMRFNADKATVYSGGKAKTVELTGGVFTETLESGGACFVIPYKEVSK